MQQQQPLSSALIILCLRLDCRRAATFMQELDQQHQQSPHVAKMQLVVWNKINSTKNNEPRHDIIHSPFGMNAAVTANVIHMNTKLAQVRMCS